MKIIIIGAGIAGLSTAYFLGKNDVTDVCVLEKQRTLASRASGRNSGMLHHFHPDRTMRERIAWSTRWLTLYQLRSDAPDFMQRAPSLWLLDADTKQQLEEDRERYGDWTAVPPPDVPDRFRPAGGTGDAFWVRFDGDGLLDPNHLTASLASDVGNMGIEVCAGEGVVDGTMKDRKWHVETERTTRTADLVVNAAGAWADPVGSCLGANPKQLTPESRYLFFTDEQVLDDLPYGFFWDTVNDMYFRSYNDGTLLCAGDSTPSDPGTEPESPEPNPHLDEQLKGHYPQFRDLRVPDHCHWYGQRTFPPDRVPYVRRDPDVPRLIWSAGLGGHGISASMWVGQHTANLVKQEHRGTGAIA